MKTFIWWVKFILLFIWQLPQNIVALVMLPFLGKLRLISCKNYNYCFEAERMSGGISLGSFCFVSKSGAKRVKQSHMLGWLYLFIIGIPSICWAWAYNPYGLENYYKFYTEKWANKLAGLETYGHYHLLRFKDK